MTDARLPGRWLTSPVMESLSDAAWRVYTAALMHSAEQETDGLILKGSLRLLHPDGTHTKANAELVAKGLWKPEGTGFRVCDWSDTQSTSTQLKTARENARERKQRQREKARVTRDVTRDDGEGVTRGVTANDVGKARQGEERQGQDGQPHGSREATVTSWPTREPGTDEWAGADVSSF